MIASTKQHYQIVIVEEYLKCGYFPLVICASSNDFFQNRLKKATIYQSTRLLVYLSILNIL